MDFSRVDLLNANSYLEQKINLTGGLKDSDPGSPTYKKQLFLIPKFTVVGFPMQNAEKTSYYYIEMQVLGAYVPDLDKNAEKVGGLIQDVIFQYDLNYSNIEQARGQISVSKLIKWSPFLGWIDLLENNKTGVYVDVPYYYIKWITYKILLPTIAIKKNSVNVLNYSFNGKEPNDPKTTRHINNKSNYGTLSFYFNENPMYQLQVKPAMFLNNNFNLEIKNPIVLTTAFDVLKPFNIFSKSNLNDVVIGGKSIIDEVFNISGNNINVVNIVPIKVKHYLLSYFPKIKYWYESREEIFRKILIFSGNFDLQQNTILNINDEEIKYYKDTKIPVALAQNDNLENDDMLVEEYNLIFNSVLYDNKTNKILMNDEVLKNQFDLPWFDKFHFNITIPLTFQTFFKYDLNLKFIEESVEPIIGDQYGLISIQKLTKDNEENWIKTTNISLSYQEILNFYSSNSFTFLDYEHLNKEIGDNKHV